ncbi:MAG: hypothetical protein U1A78_18555 [Polyangia bacterium]
MSLNKILLTVAAGLVGVGAAVWGLGGRGSGQGQARPQPQPQPRDPGWHRATRLATAQDHPGPLATDGEYVYYMTGGFQRAPDNAIRRVPVTGGPSEILARGDFVPSGGIACDGSHVYWTNANQPSVMRVAKTGGPPQVVLRELPQGPRELTIDGTHVYVATFRRDTPGFIVRAPKAGGPTQTLISGRDAIHGLTLDEGWLYFVGGQEILRIYKEGSEVKTVLPKQDRVAAIRLLADAQYLYFFHEESTVGRYVLARMPKAGGTVTPLSPRGTSVKQIAQSDTHLYFFDSPQQDTVLVKIPKAGGEVETVDIGGHATGSLLVSGGNVYFTDIDSVYRLPR